MEVRLGKSAYIEHSNLFSTRQCVSETVTHRSQRGVKKV
jgi:hypothetical protein